MAKKPEIPESQWLDWLRDYENGRPLPAIAAEADRSLRTVRERIKALKQARDFAATGLEGTQEALKRHQQDLLSAMRRLWEAVGAPSGLASVQPLRGMEYGLEGLWPPEDAKLYLKVGYGAGGAGLEFEPSAADFARSTPSEPLLVVERDGDGPRQATLSDEGGKLWRALREHLSASDPLWRRVAAWKKLLLAELQAQAALNRLIRAEAERAAGAPLAYRVKSGQPSLYNSVVWWARQEIVHLINADLPRWGDWELRENGGRLEVGGHWGIAEWLPEVQAARERLSAAPAKLAKTAEAEMATKTAAERERAGQRVRDELEEWLLIHHVTRQCYLCLRLTSAR